MVQNLLTDTFKKPSIENDIKAKSKDLDQKEQTIKNRTIGIIQIKDILNLFKGKTFQSNFLITCIPLKNFQIHKIFLNL